MSMNRYTRVSTRRLTEVGVLASFLALAMAGSYDSAGACEEHSLYGNGRTIDESSVIDGMGANPLGGSGCPDPECQSPCAVVNTSTPFVRLPAYASNPLAPGSHCFDIAKRDQNFYVQLKNETAGFHRNVSTDGGFTWTTDGPLVFPKDQGWWTLLKCPDLQYLENGDLLLYFTGGMGGDEYAIGRALSTDDGVTWDFDSEPVLTSPDPGWRIENPSVLRRSDTQWLMAYTLDCIEHPTHPPFMMAQIHLASSTDGIDWTHLDDINPALEPGACGSWDQGGLANPVILADPNSSSTLHLFYTGGNWNGSTTRGCAKFGHAISTNNGRDWCKTGVVLDRPPVGGSGGSAWDTREYLVSSFTLEPNGVLRMYYWAKSLGSQPILGLGVAEASWPLAGCGPLTGDDVRLDASASHTHTPEVEPTLGFELRARPNPTAGGVSIHHDLPSGVDGSGSMTILDIQGRRVATIWRGELSQTPAQFEWDGLDEANVRVAAGRYLIRLERAGEAIATGWLTMMP